MATSHLVIGLPCSGKTTGLKWLEEECGLLLLTLDGWHIKQFAKNPEAV